MQSLMGGRPTAGAVAPSPVRCAQVKPTINKAACKVAEPGSVMFNFARCGVIVVDDTSEDAVYEAAMDAGAEDIQPAAEDEDGTPSTSYRVGGVPAG